MRLDDKAIREKLRSFLESRSPRPHMVIEELGVHNGNAIADIVAIYQHSHCFEIKGETDTINRLARQASYYNLSFTKITLVTTINHLQKAEELLPNFWGILIVEPSNGDIHIRYHRKVRRNPLFDKKKALMSLWKGELWDIAQKLNHENLKKSFTRNDLAHYISNISSKEDIVHFLNEAITERTTQKFIQQSPL